MLNKYRCEETALHLAARTSRTQVLQKLLVWSTEKMSAKEINELLLAKDGMKKTVFHFAARCGKGEVLQKLRIEIKRN